MTDIGMQFTLSGDREMASYLGRLAQDTRGRFLENCVLAGGLPVANQAKTNLNTTPSKALERAGEPITLTGNLARSVHVSGGRGLEGSTGTDIGGLKSSATIAECLVGTNVAYAARIEFGFVGADSLGRKYHQPANAYLRPAFSTSRDAVRSAMLGAARDQLMAMHR